MPRPTSRLTSDLNSYGGLTDRCLISHRHFHYDIPLMMSIPSKKGLPADGMFLERFRRRCHSNTSDLQIRSATKSAIFAAYRVLKSHDGDIGGDPGTDSDVSNKKGPRTFATQTLERVQGVRYLCSIRPQLNHSVTPSRGKACIKERLDGRNRGLKEAD